MNEFSWCLNGITIQSYEIREFAQLRNTNAGEAHWLNLNHYRELVEIAQNSYAIHIKLIQK